MYKSLKKLLNGGAALGACMMTVNPVFAEISSSLLKL
jgi:hypothetical protein